MLFLALGAVVLGVGCKGGDSAKSSEPPATFAQVQPILTAKCAGCHGGANPKEGINLTNYEGVAKVVTPGDPKKSEIILAMQGGEGHKRMPPTGDPVATDQIKIVKSWIRGGAKKS